MWVILGVLAIIISLINLYLFLRGKDYRLAMAMGLSLTALTLVAEYRMVANWVRLDDYVAILDVVPTMEKALWILTILSIILNVTPLLLEIKNGKQEARLEN